MDENEELKINFHGNQYTTTRWWWEDRDFHAHTSGGYFVFKNAYPIKIDYEGLDYSQNDLVTITPTMRYERTDVEKDTCL